jgi:flagellin-like hook-associated protein FlgL
MTSGLGGVANYAQLLDLQRSLSLQNNELSGLQKELGGTRRDGFVGLARAALNGEGFGSDMVRVQQFRQTTAESTIYLRAVDSAQYRTDLYAKSLGGLNTIAKDIKAEIIKTQSLGPAAYGAQLSLVNSALTRIQSILNQTDGQRFVFGGSSYNTQPVQGLASLDPLPPTAMPAYATYTGQPGEGPPRDVGNVYANAVQTSSTLPAAPIFRSDSATSQTTDVAPGYITPALRGQLVNAAGESIANKPSVYIDDQLNMQFGITASEAGFQNLINGLRNYKIALGAAINANAAVVPPAQPQDISAIPAAAPFLAQATVQVNRALLDISSLEGVNGGNQAQLVQIRAKHESLIDASKEGASKIEAVDTGDVSTRIKAIQTSLEASYVTTRQILELSLVKFLR